MSQVLVWKSDVDGKLFEDKAKYQSHLRKLARHRNAQQKLQIERDRIAMDAKKEDARLQSQERQGDKRIRADIAKAGIKTQSTSTVVNEGNYRRS